SYEMHRLVQIATRRWLESECTIQEWEVRAMTRMAKSFPIAKFENWAVCETLLPHAEEIINYTLADDEDSQLQRAYVLENMASYYFLGKGIYDLAAKREKQTLNIKRQFLGEQDRRTVASMTLLVSIYQCQGQYNLAEELGLQVLESRRRLLGQEHPD